MKPATHIAGRKDAGKTLCGRSTGHVSWTKIDGGVHAMVRDVVLDKNPHAATCRKCRRIRDGRESY